MEINQSHKQVNYHLHIQELVSYFPRSPQGQLITANFAGLTFVSLVINAPDPGINSCFGCLVCFNIVGGGLVFTKAGLHRELGCQVHLCVSDTSLMCVHEPVDPCLWKAWINSGM